MAEVSLSRLEPEVAAQLLQGFERYDAAGLMAGPQDVLEMCARNLCFGVTVGASQGVYVLHVKNGRAWMEAAHGMGPTNLLDSVMPAVELQCARLRSLSFATTRPGLVRKAGQRGYRLRGWIMEKELQA